ncbi:hypothetical protein COT30_03570 [Candidatus Micrarchaeota archaeon CG08_land_8_20_14_0_20_49_17]|nr:MAG: hypothetical protein AUJ13_03350 [Candidatus Micrarchaeota archaeon CG1_02_49_24]PIU09606.1 MAG: hypothetical protein COT30_03570 [Candidatus Micrarchaeota archaeon CG08_land_8_20_14_0_20_49_17]PIU82629.1 MAG: hypothetical protein COS70_00315 [Candidatus Micrarchaeota archaeon CG06_land_8_20_14_3_00_50_6]PIZ97965.1 MAG: hypothetical protein COX84_02740 [Candidatus Micrarchaeota archaeon CG_4_10_14_0_2_um_filter_49_7]
MTGNCNSSRCDFLQGYSVGYEPGWDKYFSGLDKSVRQRLFNKIVQLRTGICGRHLKHGLPFFVEEVGGYRIAYTSDEKMKARRVFFAGSHKDYGKWYKSQ